MKVTRDAVDRLAEASATMAGQAFGALFGALARLRRNRPLHPRGTTYAARVHVLGRRGSGVPWLDEPGTHDATLRLSRSAGLPGWLPDVYGVALRLGADTTTPVDLLFSSAGRSAFGRFFLLPRFRASGGHFTTLWPVRSPAGPLLLRLVADGTGSRAGAHPSRLRLSWASGRGPWREAGEVAVGEPLPDQVDQERHDAVLHQLPGTQQYEVARRFREPSYRAARSAHSRPPARPLP